MFCWTFTVWNILLVLKPSNISACQWSSEVAYRAQVKLVRTQRISTFGNQGVFLWERITEQPGSAVPQTFSPCQPAQELREGNSWPNFHCLCVQQKVLPWQEVDLSDTCRWKQCSWNSCKDGSSFPSCNVHLLQLHADMWKRAVLRDCSSVHLAATCFNKAE